MSGKVERVPTYNPKVFKRLTLEEAKRVILTPEPKTSSEERWEKETPRFAEELIETLKPGKDSLLLDYGCGIGRLAKELIERSGCTVIGIDISRRMLSFAHGYVGSERFAGATRQGLLAMLQAGLRVDGAFAVWVLQHSLKPESDIALLQAALKAGGRLQVINALKRWVPTDEGWNNDGKDVWDMLEDRFTRIEERPLPKGSVSKPLRERCRSRLYEPVK